MPVHLVCPAGHRWEVAAPPGCPVCGSPGAALAVADPKAETATPEVGPALGADSTVRPPDDASTRSRPPGLTAFAARLEALAANAPAIPRAGPPAAGAPLPHAPAFEGYTVIEELGRGGMGVVYLAVEERLARVVAVKTLRDGALVGDNALRRFQAEAEAVARLRHDHIVQIHHIGAAGPGGDRLPYMVLEFVEGGSLEKKIAGTPWPAQKAAGLVEKVARAVDHAHRAGIVHRDLKPSNVLLTGDGVPKVTDFGVAKRLDDAGGQTVDGSLIGTPPYMAPEQARGDTRAVGVRTDVYALGAILYELLTGRPPFRAATVVETLDQVRRQEPVPPRQLNGAVPRDLETICLKCLAKEPEKRYATAAELAEDLRRYLHNEPILARPPGVWVRFRLWCRRPERIRDAGVFMVFLSVICLLWAGLGILNLTVGAGGGPDADVMRVPDPGAARLQLAAHILVFYLPLVWIGLRTVARKRVWLWVGLAVAVGDVLVCLLALGGADVVLRFVDLGGVHRDANARAPVFSLLFMLALVQLGGFLIAVVSYYSNRDAVA